jgi:hypothetical protein
MQPKLELLTPDLIARILDEVFQLMQRSGIKVNLPQPLSCWSQLVQLLLGK